MPQNLSATNAQLDTRLKALAGVVTTVQNAGTALAIRVTKLESAPVVNYAAELAALKARMDFIENKLCPQQAVIDALVADHTPDV
jgi:hypothetical protein